MSVRIKWLGVCCFEIEHKGHHVITDPFMNVYEDTPCTVKDVEGCDMIILSHTHYDHITDMPELMRNYPCVCMVGTLSAMALCKWANCNPMFVRPMEAGNELDFDSVKVKALYGTHSDLGKNILEYPYRPFYEYVRSQYPGIEEPEMWGHLEYRNWLLTYPDGTKVLFWGSGLYPEQFHLLEGINPDVAILQGTDAHLKDMDRFTAFVQTVGAKKVIPHHMDYHKKDTWRSGMEKAWEEFAKRLPGVPFIIPEYNTWMEFENGF